MTLLRAPRLTPLRWGLTLAALSAVLLGAVVVSALVGVESVDLSHVFDPESRDHLILVDVRLPRILLGVVVGAALGSAGVTLQAILRNPLADPFILGVSGGAALGGTLALSATVALGAIAAAGGIVEPIATFLLNTGAWMGPAPVFLAASGGALCAVALTFAVARSAGGAHPHSLLLAGVVFNSFASALILFLRTVVSQQKAYELLYWLVGTLGYPSWMELGIAAAVVGAGSLVLFVLSARLNLLSVGDADAATLGIDVERTRLLLIVVSSVVVGVAVSLAGLVGFVGLMVPHLLRLLFGPDHRLLVPAAALGGAAFLVVSDLVARLFFQLLGTEPPVGVVTAFLGGPFFLVLMRQRRGLVTA